MHSNIIGTSSPMARNLTVTCSGEVAGRPPDKIPKWVRTSESIHRSGGVRANRPSLGNRKAALQSADGKQTLLEKILGSAEATRLRTWEGPALVDQRSWRHTLDWADPVSYQTDFLCDVPSSLVPTLSRRMTKLSLSFGYAGSSPAAPPARIDITVGPVVRDGPYKVAACMGPLYGKQSRAQWVQWLEFHIHIAGFEKFFLYSVDDTEQLLDVLRDYVDEGTVEVRRWETFGTREKFLESKRYYDEQPLRSHCITRNRGVATWLSFHDVDEYIFVRRGAQLGNVAALLDGLPEEVGAVRIMRHRFPVSKDFEGSGSDLVIQKHLNRSAIFDENQGKPIVRTEVAREVTAHELEFFENGQSKTAENSITLPIDWAIINHYRREPVQGDPNELFDRFARKHV
ncbi:hypothetical protein KFL_000250480 [Klebsormidium nitens]|uniref:Glycosyltransferase family 92 protein n=1 Tax=Klebsormidium nitens TaxID=105231 RepID=A0A1Y1HKP4_KLENI|nr:hypothetical protein KFL_000250480 [Klebsormidium nitens]|eukprot:GAQ79170.1 hypothetical protein KFL_000250480 [Klebsormidium nitens]